ncbi:MAG TPA: hypothetical protein VKT77_13840 [Chthonomonadaceae bacterium]|nr:hypothetical protein [Chthonomonadaceae bacterium]
MKRLGLGRREFLLGAITTAGATLGLDGCGGGGGSAGSAIVRSRAALPAGFRLPATQLAVENVLASSAVAADGSFNAGVSGSLPALVYARDTVSGRGIMFGYVDPAAPASSLDSTAQAVALLYFAFGGYGVTGDQKRTLLNLIASAPATAAFAAVIASRIAADPFALEDGDAQIGAAFATAFNAIAPASRSLPRVAGAATTSFVTNRSTVYRAAGPSQQLLVNPSGIVSGVEVLQDSNSVGILATNHFRRRCQVLLYRVADQTGAGPVNTYPSVVPVGSPVDLGPTTALGVFSTLSNLFSGQTAFTPVTTPLISVPLAPGTTKSFYDVIVLGSANVTTGDPAFFSESQYGAVVAGWRSIRQTLNLTSFLADVAFGLVVEMAGLTSIVPASTAISTAVNDLHSYPDTNVQSLLSNIYLGKISDNLPLYLTLVAGSDTIGLGMRRIVSRMLLKATEQAALQAAAALPARVLSLVLKMLTAALGAAGLVLGAGDIAAISHDLSVADAADRWNATVFQPTVTINPSGANLKAGAAQSFTAKVPAGTTGTIVYDWSTTATFAVLSDGIGMTGRNFESSSATVSLQTTPSDQGTLTVSVSAFVVGPGGGKSAIGSATATVTFNDIAGLPITISNLSAPTDPSQVHILAGAHGIPGYIHAVDKGAGGLALSQIFISCTPLQFNLGDSAATYEVGIQWNFPTSVAQVPLVAGMSVPLTPFVDPNELTNTNATAYAVLTEVSPMGFAYRPATGSITIAAVDAASATVHISAHMELEVPQGGSLDPTKSFDLDAQGTIPLTVYHAS